MGKEVMANIVYLRNSQNNIFLYICKNASMTQEKSEKFPLFSTALVFSMHPFLYAQPFSVT